MRLLVVTHYFWPESFRVNELVAQLVLRGHEVTVLAGLPNYPEGRVFAEFQRDPTRFSRYEGAEVVRVPLITRGNNRFRLALNYLSAMLGAAVIGPWRLRGRAFDAIFVYQPSPFTTLLPALLLGRLKRAPVFPWVLDLWPETLSAVGVVRSPWLLGLLGRLIAITYRRCALILAQSRAIAERIERRVGDPARVRYFPGWTEPLILAGRPADLETAPEVRPFADTFNVMYAGNIGQAQDFPAILDAAEALRARSDIRWLIVGEGRMADWVRGEIARRDLGASVRMLGRHPIERMPSFFRVAGAMLVTLKRDPVFAMTVPGRVQTFLASGLPIVGMIDGEVARVIQEAGAGVVCPAGDGRALAERVCQLAALPESERREMGARGIAYADREFNRDRLVTQLERWLMERVSAVAR